MARLCFGLLLLFCSAVYSTTDVITDASTETTTNTPPTTTEITPTPSIDEVCGLLNTSCSDCVKNSQCFWCYKTSVCAHYPFNVHKFWIEGCGPMSQMAWGTCLVNFQALIISMAVLAGVVLLSLVICCCCCCKKRKANIWARNQAKWERQREERKARSEERKKERQSKTDEIRRKYGLVKDDNPYQRFDA